MRVALVVPGGVDRSGRERVVPAFLWLVERLARRHEVVVFALAQEPRPSRYPLLGATVVNLGLQALRPGTRLVVALHRLSRGMEDEGPFQIVHALFGDMPALLATLAARRLGVPCLVSLCGGELVSQPEIGYGSSRLLWPRLQVTVALRLASLLTAQSRPMLVSLGETGHVGLEVPLGVPASLLRELPPARTHPPFHLVSVGSLNRVKDHDTLLRSFRRVVDRRGADVRLSVVGEDVLGGSVQRLAAELGLGRLVTFHGLLSSEEVMALHDTADLLVVSSRHEAGCVAVLEAAARGFPIVGTRVGHVADLAPRGAVAVPVGDDAALAGEILALLDDPARRTRLARVAGAFAREHDADATAGRFESLYESLVR